MDGQKKMEAYMEKTIQEIRVDQAEIVNGMMHAEYLGCSFEDKSVKFLFPVLPWQANRVGVMHGGAMCTAFDLSMAALARFVAESNFTPTISLEVKYIRPVQMGDRLVVTTRATTAGRRISQFVSEAVIESTGKLAATATSVYMNIDITKER